MTVQGPVYCFGDDVNTDEIILARYLNSTDPDMLAEHCMEDVRPGFAAAVQPGSIIAAGSNFGCGSSREHAPMAIKAASSPSHLPGSFSAMPSILGCPSWNALRSSANSQKETLCMWT